MSTVSTSKLRVFAQLLRPANVVTALADVLAGYALAEKGELRLLPWLLASTVCLYGGGIVLNDFFDRNLDAVERPERPIPSGRISAATAARLGFVLLVAGIGFAFAANALAGVIAIAISASVLLYDRWGKHQKFFGPVNMGTCRGLNLLLGMAVVPHVVAVCWMLALLPLVYIAAVTTLSRGEVRGGKRPVAIFCLGLIVLVLGGLTYIAWYSVPALAVTAFLAWRVLPPFIRACKEPVPLVIRTAIKAGVLSLVLLDAALAATYSGALFCLIILAIAILAAALAKAFAVT